MNYVLFYVSAGCGGHGTAALQRAQGAMVAICRKRQPAAGRRLGSRSLWHRRTAHLAPGGTDERRKCCCVMYRGTTGVVVEEGEHVRVFRPGFGYPLHPAVQCTLAISRPWLRRALVETQVAPVSGTPQRADRAAAPVCPAQRGVVPGQQGADLVGPPRVVSAFDGDAHGVTRSGPRLAAGTRRTRAGTRPGPRRRRGDSGAAGAAPVRAGHQALPPRAAGARLAQPDHEAAGRG